MKKYLVAMAVALMVCMLGMTAAADEAEAVDVEAAVEEQKALDQECYALMDEIDPNGVDIKTQKRIITEVYEDAGWTVTQKAPAARSVDIDPETLKLAYSDIDNASPEMKEKILDAREVVIFHSTWFNDTKNDNTFAYGVHPATKEIEFPPLFSELFPGWDPPRPDAEDFEPSEPIDSVAEGCAAARESSFEYFSIKETCIYKSRMG